MQHFDKEILMEMMDNPHEWQVIPSEKIMNHINGLTIFMRGFSIIVRQPHDRPETYYKILKLTDVGHKADILFKFLLKSDKLKQSKRVKERTIRDLLKL